MRLVILLDTPIRNSGTFSNKLDQSLHGYIDDTVVQGITLGK